MSFTLLPPLPSPLAHPEAPFVIDGPTVLTHAEVDRLAEAAAARLRAMGVAPGVRVALFLSNDWRFIVLLLGLLRNGSVAAPLSTRFPASALPPLLRQIDATMLITNKDVSGDLSLSVQAPEALIEEAEPEGAALDLARPATLVFTSGSTGEPKAALHSLANHFFSAQGSAQNLPLAPDDRWLLNLPLYHVGGLAIVFRCLFAGATVVVAGRSVGLGEEIARHRITHVSLVATQLQRLLEEGSEPPSHLRAVLLGGSALPAPLVREAHARGWPIHTSYGLTEMASQVATTPPGASVSQLLTSGRVLPYRQLRLAPDGELLVKGETLFLGYAARDTLHRPFDEAGWFATGDLGRLDADGFLHVVGRKDEMFISGGENIHPQEIERALAQVAGVSRSVVVPVPDDEFGARPVAFVEGEESVLEALPKSLISLPRFKIPVAFYPWPNDLPGGMKINRAFFRKRASKLYAVKR